MANRTPHVVGGGLGTFRREDTAKAVKAAKAKQDKDNRNALAKVVRASK